MGPCRGDPLGRPRQMMSKSLLITVDCDLRSDDVVLRQKSLDVLLRMFADVGVSGHTTWFLNENDFQITENHPAFLREALRRGDTLGVHDHFEPFKGVYEAKPIQEFCVRSKRSVAEWLAAEGHAQEIVHHRNGCLAQHPNVYTALRQLGYTVVSEVYPGKMLPDRAGYAAFDNRAVPAGILPYRHDEANFDEYRSTRGHFLHFPVMHMGLRDFNFDTVDRWVEAFSEAAVEQAMFVWLFHPYEIMNPERTGMSESRVDWLAAQIRRFADEYQTRFANMAESRAVLAGKE